MPATQTRSLMKRILGRLPLIGGRTGLVASDSSSGMTMGGHGTDAQYPWIIRGLQRVRMLGISAAAESAYERWLRWRYRFGGVNRAAGRAFRASPPALGPGQQRVLADLQRDGIAHAQFHELFADAGYWDHLKKQLNSWLNTDEVRVRESAYRDGRGTAIKMGHRAKKDYLVRMYGAGAAVSWDCPWLQLGLRPEIRAIANRYFEMFTSLHYVDVWDTIPLEHDGPDVGSQRWHRDAEDVRLVKVFVYFTNVDETAGPLQYVRHSRRGDRHGHLWPHRVMRGTLAPRDELETKIPRSDRQVCTYPEGTLVFVDTTGLHKGGRATGRQRVFAALTYTSPSTVWPRTFVPTGVPDRATLSIADRIAISD